MTIAIDFDGTLVEDRYPAIGNLLPCAKETVQRLKKEGWTIVLWTCRKNEHLADAVNFMLENDLPFDRVNDNTPACKQQYGGDTRKVCADLYLDDRQFGGLPTWEEIYFALFKQRLSDVLMAEDAGKVFP